MFVFCNVIGDAAVGGVKQQKKNLAAGEGRNRRAALHDIGNVVTAVRGVEVKPNRPITRFLSSLSLHLLFSLFTLVTY